MQSFISRCGSSTVGRKRHCGRKQRRNSPPAPVFRTRRSTFPTGFHVRRFQGPSLVWNLGCSMAPNYVPSRPARTPHYSFRSHLFPTTLKAALLNPCHSHWLELPLSRQNPMQQPASQTIPQRDSEAQSLANLQCPGEGHRPAGRTAQTMVLLMVLVSCQLCWGSGWASVYLNYRFMSTAALYLCEKYYLSSLCTDSREFSSRSFGIPDDCPDSQMKNVCNLFPYLIAFPHLSLMS